MPIDSGGQDVGVPMLVGRAEESVSVNPLTFLSDQHLDFTSKSARRRLASRVVDLT